MSPLAAKWGGQLDANTALAETFARSRLPADSFERLKNAGLLKDPAVVELFYGLHGETKEGEPDLSAHVPADQLAQIEAKVHEMQSDLKGPLYKEDHPQHKATRLEFDRLVAILEKVRARKTP